MLPHITSAAVAALLIAQTPAYAQEAPPTEEFTVRNPWLASGLSLATPLVLVPAAGIVGSGLGMSHFPWFVAPLGFGAGHFYAGDPWRGALVSLGGVLVINGAARASVRSQHSDSGMPNIVSMDQVYTWLSVAGIAYGLWVSWDAHATADRLNNEPRSGLRPEPGTNR